jgi:hypothetical protein
MKCMGFGLAIATAAGFISLMLGHGLLWTLLIYSLAGQVAMLAAAGTSYVYHQFSA